MSAEMYRQCVLERKIAAGTVTEVSWIPEKFAVSGKALKIKDSQGEWVDGWIVASAGTTRLPREALDNQRDAQREFSRKLGVKQDRSTGSRYET